MVAFLRSPACSKNALPPAWGPAFTTKMLDRCCPAARGRFLVPHLAVTFSCFSWRILILPLPEDGELHEPHKTNRHAAHVRPQKAHSRGSGTRSCRGRRPARRARSRATAAGISRPRRAGSGPLRGLGGQRHRLGLLTAQKPAARDPDVDSLLWPPTRP